MTRSVYLGFFIGLGLVGGLASRSCAALATIAPDALVIIATLDLSGKHPVSAWPRDWPLLDAKRLDGEKDPSYLLAISEQTLRDSRLYQKVVLDGGPVWFKGDSWRLSYRVPLPGQTLDEMAAEERESLKKAGADIAPRANAVHLPRPIQNPELQDLLASALNHQLDRNYVDAILEYDQVLSEGFVPDLAFRLLLRCYEAQLVDELTAAVANKDTAVNTVAQQNLPDLCFDECPVLDINWRQANPRS